jgi:hypothetical protein
MRASHGTVRYETASNDFHAMSATNTPDRFATT